MQDQYFGHKELYEVVLRAKTPMRFGSREIEADEPVLYFDNVNMSLLTEQNRPIFAQGGWANLPRVIWDERSEVQFQMTEGVMSSVGMSILLSANVLSEDKAQPMHVNVREGPLEPYTTVEKEVEGETLNFPVIELSRWPIIFYPEKKTFIFEYARNSIQNKVWVNSVEIKEELVQTHN